MTFEQKLFNALRPKRSPVRKHRKGGARRGPWRSEAKRRWIAALPCLITGRAAQCAHVENNGMRSKGSDEFTVPLAPEIHDQFDGRANLPNGEVGKAAFQAYYNTDLLERALQLHMNWLGAGPECSCSFSGDQADARGCEYHQNLKVPNHLEAQDGDTCPF